MEIRFQDADYERLEKDPGSNAKFDAAIVRAFRNRINLIRQALDERDIYAFRSWRFERLKGTRNHQYSIRLNDQWRLIVEMVGTAPNKTIVIIQVEDYH